MEHTLLSLSDRVDVSIDVDHPTHGNCFAKQKLRSALGKPFSNSVWSLLAWRVRKRWQYPEVFSGARSREHWGHNPNDASVLIEWQYQQSCFIHFGSIAQSLDRSVERPIVLVFHHLNVVFWSFDHSITRTLLVIWPIMWSFDHAFIRPRESLIRVAECTRDQNFTWSVK